MDQEDAAGSDLRMVEEAGRKVDRDAEENQMKKGSVNMMTGELLRQIFHEQIDLMKDMLERGEMIYGGDRENPGYKRFKQETMRVHYNAIDSFWTLLQANGFVEKCECNAMARCWTDCELCGGSGFKAVVEKEEVKASTQVEEALDGATGDTG